MLASSTVSCKIIVSQQLEAHKKKITSAKACVDNKAPCSLFTNPKAKYYSKQRELVRLSRLSSRQNKSARYCKNHKKLVGLKDPVVTDIAAKLIEKYESRVKTSVNHKKAIEPPSARLGISTRIHQYNHPLLDPSPDLLKLHSHLFTDEKEFYPRTLKSSASSRIRNLACYNPPKQCSSGRFVERYASGKSDLALSRDSYLLKGTKIPSASANRNSSPSIHGTPRKIQSAKKYAGHFPKSSREDVNFLKFSTAITNDILQNKLFSNRELMAVFRSHLEDSSAKISREGRIRAIRQIGEQLNVPQELIAKLLSPVSQLKASEPAPTVSHENATTQSYEGLTIVNEGDKNNKLTFSPNSLKYGGDKMNDIGNASKPQSEMAESLKTKPSFGQPFVMSSLKETSDCEFSVREVSGLLSSLEIRRVTGKSPEEEFYDDDFEASNDDDDDDDDRKADVEDVDIGRLGDDYSDDSFEEDDGDE